MRLIYKLTGLAAMNILHIIDSEGLYGAEIMLLNLVAEQKNAGHMPIIINMRPCDAAVQSIESEALKKNIAFKVISLKAGFDIWGAFKILKFAKICKCDIIHSHGYKSNILLGLMPKFFKNPPIISTLHGWTSTEKLSKIRLFELLDLFSLKFVNAVVVVSRAMQSHPGLKKSKLKLQEVNNGIPEIYFNDADLNKNIQTFCSKSFVIGAIGRLSKEKGFEYLVNALYLLCKKNISARLIIIGEGPARRRLESNIRDMKLQDKVLMPGYMDSAKQYLPNFDVFVISSVTEGLPITLLEAMQAKTPVVATKVGGIPYVLENNESGLLIKPRSPDAIAQAVIALHNNKQLADKLTSKAYHRVITDFSSKAMALEYLNVYKNTLIY